MPWIMQMVGFALLLVGIAIALWVSVWVVAFLLAVGIAGVVWSHLREFFTEKGILHPRFTQPEEEDQPSITIVEGDFTRIDESTQVESKD